MTSDDSSPTTSPEENEDIETTFRRLRREGHSRLEAVRIILDALDVSLAKAKRLLLTNKTWKEARSARDDDGSSSSSVPPAPG